MQAYKKDIGTLILIVTGILVAIAFTVAIANETNKQTTIQFMANETLNFATARTGNANNINQAVNFTISRGQAFTNKTPITNFVMLNQSGQLISAGNYTFDSVTGRVSFINNSYLVITSLTNISLISYNFKDTNYIDDVPSQGLVGLIVLIAIVGLFAWVAGRYWELPGLKNILRLGGHTRVISR